MNNNTIKEILDENRDDNALLMTSLGHFKREHASIFLRTHHVKSFNSFERFLVFCGLQPQGYQFYKNYEGPYGNSKSDEIVDKFATQYLTVEDNGFDMITKGVLSDENIVRLSSVLLFNRLLNPDPNHKKVWFVASSASSVADDR